MNFVLDSSLAMAFVLKDEATLQTDHVLDGFGQGAKAVAPALWRWEVANALLVAERRKRITQADTERHFNQLNNLPIEADDSAFEQAWLDAQRLARKHKLSCYGAAYLEMAIRLVLALGSLDTMLRAATQLEKIPVLPETL